MPPPPRTNALERAVAVLGVVLTAGLLAFLVWDALRGGGGPPALRVSLGAARAEGGTVVVPVRVHNAGGQAGEDVLIEVCRGAGPAEECAETTFPFAPRGASRDAVVAFDGPGPAPRARVVSYQVP